MEQATVASSNDYNAGTPSTPQQGDWPASAETQPCQTSGEVPQQSHQGWGPLSPSISSNDSEVETISTTLRAVSRLDKRLASSQASVA